MANLNKVMLIGRLTREPETRTTGGGTTITKFGFAVDNKKKNQQTGQYDNDPVFLDMVAFGKTADMVTQYLHKGIEAYIEGRLQLEKWTDKGSNQQRSKVSIIVDNVQFLGGKKQEQRQERSDGGDDYADAPVSEDMADVPF